MYEKIDKSLYTPMMRQYLTIKENYPDALVFFRLGDFYEMFFNDAIVASKELEIVLTGRDAGINTERVPMCGVPFHAVEGYLERLSSKGYKVAIVEQLEEANNSGIVSRDVVRVVTPGTNLNENFLNEKDNNYLASISKVDEAYYFSYLDLSTGDARTTIFPNQIEAIYNEINKLKIKEVILPFNFPKIYGEYLKTNFNLVVTIQDNDNIDSYLNSLIEHLDRNSKQNAKRLLSYLIKTQKRTLVHLKQFEIYQNKDYLRMDAKTIRNLELIESISGNRFKNNLFACLDKCATSMGSRHLKRSIIYPFTTLKPIEKRLQMIEDFSKNYLISLDIKEELKEIYDLERIVGRISYGNLSPKDLIQLKKSLKVIPKIKLLLKKIKSEIIRSFEKTIQPFDELASLLEEAINEDAPFLLRDGNVIKAGFSEELDKIKNISFTNKEFLTNLEKKERERTGIKSLKVGFNKVFGYYIEVTKSNLSLVKDEYGYIRKQTTSNAERYITEELKEREALILRSDERALQLEIELFNDIRNHCRTFSSNLQQLASIICELDLVLALEQVARHNQYVRPNFSFYHEIDIKDGRHPVIEIANSNPFIPNDLLMGNNELILLITGPNMSGKSTYMRQNAIIVILAQMGSFVPARYAKLPLFDAIFTRIGSSDDIASGESTFMTEMLEVNYALQNATPRSLILLDEVGRGTATFDGMALAQAIIEYLHDEIGAKVLFSTHYHELTSLDQSLSSLQNVHVEAKEDNGTIVFFHKVMKGATDQSYGIHVASLAQLPISVTLRAKDILQKMERKNIYEVELLSKHNYQEPIIINKLNPKAESVINEIKEMTIDELRPIDALTKLSQLKERLDK